MNLCVPGDLTSIYIFFRNSIIVKIIYQCVWHKSFTVALTSCVGWVKQETEREINKGSKKERKKNCKFNEIFSRMMDWRLRNMPRRITLSLSIFTSSKEESSLFIAAQFTVSSLNILRMKWYSGERNPKANTRTTKTKSWNFFFLLFFWFFIFAKLIRVLSFLLVLVKSLGKLKLIFYSLG